MRRTVLPAEAALRADELAAFHRTEIAKRSELVKRSGAQVDRVEFSSQQTKTGDKP